MNEKINGNELVSVIMPAYNCADYIGESIDSVIAQTYENWELVIVDDCSTDNTEEIIDRYIQKDNRIRYFKLEQNSGAAIARNKAVEVAQGIYLAFLDSDDLWVNTKLEKQIKFMSENGYSFTCTTYGKIDEESNIKNKVIRCKKNYDYDVVLKDCPGNSTVIYNAKVLGKFYIENIKRRNDFVMWLKVIKTAKKAYGLDELLMYHRERNGSISFDKKKLIRYQWDVYRKIEKLSMVKSVYLVVYKISSSLFLKYL